MLVTYGGTKSAFQTRKTSLPPATQRRSSDQNVLLPKAKLPQIRAPSITPTDLVPYQDNSNTVKALDTAKGMAQNRLFLRRLNNIKDKMDSHMETLRITPD